LAWFALKESIDLLTQDDLCHSDEVKSEDMSNCPLPLVGEGEGKSYVSPHFSYAQTQYS
jgi:hypothetical protein